MLLRFRPEPTRAITLLFSLTAFLSACLMFVIEPMAAKALLQGFGGRASVWAGVIVFFQLCVLLGCAVTQLAVARLGLARATTLLFVCGIIGALLAPCLPRMLDLGLGPPMGSVLGPLATVLLSLAASYGPALVALASATPLLQHWYVRLAGQEPFSLYAISNAGGLAGLALYPVLLDQLLGMTMQGAVWRALYLLWLAALAACAALALHRPGSVFADMLADLPPGPPPAPARRLAWVVLAAIPASLLLGVTQHLTTDIAPFPLLWTLPLALYLLTIAGGFGFPRGTLLRGRVYQACAMPPLVVLALLPPVEAAMPVRSVVMHLVAFAGCGMLCHGELARLRPGAGRLGEFWLLVSLGAALGGLFNAVAAPLLFDRLTEYPLMLAATSLVAGPLFRRRLPREVALLPALWLLGVILARIYGAGGAAGWLLVDRPAFIAVALGCTALAMTTTRLGFAAVCLVGLVLPLYLPAAMGGREVYASRDFYGPLRVSDRDGARDLMQGADLRARQRLDAAETAVPLSDGSGIARLIAMMKEHPPADGRKLDILAIGLGTGALSCAVDDKARVSFIEIDPGAVAMARRAFPFLRICGPAEVRIGDGRAVLAEQWDGTLDLVALNAFAADTVPAHLITAEAVRLYLDKLRAGGAIAIHLPLRVLDLSAVVAGSAAASGASALRYRAEPPSVALASEWAVIATDPALIDNLLASGWSPMAADPDQPVWRDDKWDVTRILRIFDTDTDGGAGGGYFPG